MPLFWILYYGDVDIATWEWPVSILYILLLYTYFARMKNVAIKKDPEYKHLLWGLFAKLFGGIAFSLIYFYYYKGGDTISYFYSAIPLSRMARVDFTTFLSLLFGPNDLEHLQMFYKVGVIPYTYVYFDSRTFLVIRLITPLVIITFNSFLITTLMLSSICYIGIWRCYRTFVSYYPSLMNKLAIAFLYMPSVVFWGSGILKDTITLSATCWWIHCLDEVFFKRRRFFFNILGLVVSTTLLIMIKAYIFMALFPVSLLWLFFYRVSRMKNALLRYGTLPLAMIMILTMSLFVLTYFQDSLGKFALDKAAETVMVSQADLKRTEQYGDNFFDLGPMDGTFTGMLKKFPKAVNAALFRPYIWESSSVVVALSALENFWLFGFLLYILWRTRVWYLLRIITGNPLVLMCILFSVIFGFIIGISTPNFGALVRFKIPLVPFFVAAMFICKLILDRRREKMRKGERFRLRDYMAGEQLVSTIGKRPDARMRGTSQITGHRSSQR
ncbi:MAG: hypothetical protein IPO60_13190 [Flavobacteriales bacterium]|nr:hypothetical protein [Flavobacteriales bacterium]MBK7246852.1 hypothetical protein [Flavobacteriales bacterium]MBK9061439.1 hypothetical protein [Flavobacteriales bacterium]MBK9599237.1 hypothetical protein [Flavobacteriales bacterium]QQS72524.1 MAG: hypothetical protein IPP95_15375 [Flavobacteriales bacterium]